MEDVPVMARLTLEASPIVKALHDKHVPALRRIAVEETATSVILSGRVPSYYLKQLAQEAVLPLLAGRPLTNRIEVVRD